MRLSCPSQEQGLLSLGPSIFCIFGHVFSFLTLATAPGHGGRRTLRCREALSPPHSLSVTVKQGVEVTPLPPSPAWQCERNQAVTVNTQRPRVDGDSLERGEARARWDLWLQHWRFFQHTPWSFPQTFSSTLFPRKAIRPPTF